MVQETVYYFIQFYTKLLENDCEMCHQHRVNILLVQAHSLAFPLRKGAAFRDIFMLGSFFIKMISTSTIIFRSCLETE